MEDFYTFLGIRREAVAQQETIDCVLVIDGTSLRWALE
jgi:hypothetical protein